MPPSGSAPTTISRLGLHRVAPYYYYPAWWEGGTQFSVYINSEKWNSLSKEYQAIVTAASSAAHVQCQARYDARNPAALKQLVAEGAKLNRFPKDVMDAAFKAAQEVYKELDEKNPNWKKIYPDYSRFLAQQVQWSRWMRPTSASTSPRNSSRPRSGDPGVATRGLSVP